jgi:hypothetical protein
MGELGTSSSQVGTKIARFDTSQMGAPRICGAVCTVRPLSFAHSIADPGLQAQMPEDGQMYFVSETRVG